MTKFSSDEAIYRFAKKLRRMGIDDKLKELGAKNNKLFKELNELLEEKQISLKELINDDVIVMIDVKNVFEHDEIANPILEDLKKNTNILVDAVG